MALIQDPTPTVARRAKRAQDTHHRPALRDDFIASRRTGADQVRVLAEGRARNQPRKGCSPRYPTVTLSFTANHLIDDLVQQIAGELNLSRSAAIRQAIMTYHAQVIG